MATSKEIELAWAAGFWDGEGFTGWTFHGTKLVMTCGQSSSTGIPEVLTRFHAAINMAGNIYGPYKRRHPQRDVYQWRTADRTIVPTVLDLLRPYLGVEKLTQADTAIALMPPQKRRRSGETQCIHGHDLTLPNATYNYGRRTHCKKCVIAYGKSYRAAARAA